MQQGYLRGPSQVVIGHRLCCTNRSVWSSPESHIQTNQDGSRLFSIIYEVSNKVWNDLTVSYLKQLSRHGKCWFFFPLDTHTHTHTHTHTRVLLSLEGVWSCWQRSRLWGAKTIKVPVCRCQIRADALGTSAAVLEPWRVAGKLGGPWNIVTIFILMELMIFHIYAERVPVITPSFSKSSFVTNLESSNTLLHTTEGKLYGKYVSKSH